MLNPFKRRLEEIYSEIGLRPSKRMRIEHGSSSSSSSSSKVTKFTAKPSDGITEDMIKLYSSEDNFRAGERYFEQNRVESLFLSGNDLHATVGSNEVHVVLNVENNTVQSAACNNVKQGFWCPHVVSTLLTYIKKNEKVTKLESLKSTLKSLSKEDLEQFILKTVSISHGKALSNLQDFLNEIKRKKKRNNEDQLNSEKESSPSSSSSFSPPSINGYSKLNNIENNNKELSSESDISTSEELFISKDFHSNNDLPKKTQDDRDSPLMDLGQLKRLIQEQVMFDSDDEYFDDDSDAPITSSSVSRVINPFVQKARDLARFGHIHNAFEVVGAITSELSSNLLFDDMDSEGALASLCKTWIEIILRASKEKQMKDADLEIWRMQLQRWDAMTGLFQDAISTCDIGWESATIKDVFSSENLEKYKENGLNESEKITKARMDILEEEDSLEASLKLARILHLGERASHLLLKMDRVQEILGTIPHISNAFEAYELALDMKKKDHSISFLAILRYLELSQRARVFDSVSNISSFLMDDLMPRGESPMSSIMSLTKLSSVVTAEALLNETMETKKLVLDYLVSPLKSMLMTDMVTLTCLKRDANSEEIYDLAGEFTKQKLYDNALKLFIKVIQDGYQDTEAVEMAYDIALSKKQPQYVEQVTEAVKESRFSRSAYFRFVEYLHSEKKESMTALKLGMSALDAPSRNNLSFADLYFLHQDFGEENQAELIRLLTEIVLSIDTQEAAELFANSMSSSSKLEQGPAFAAAKKLYNSNFKENALSIGLASLTAQSRDYFQGIFTMRGYEPESHPAPWVAHTAFQLGDKAMEQVVNYCKTLGSEEELSVTGYIASIFAKHGHDEYAFKLGLHTLSSYQTIIINGKTASLWVFSHAMKLGSSYLKQAVEKGIRLISNGGLLDDIAELLEPSDPESALSFYLKAVKMESSSSGKNAIRLALNTKDTFKIKEAIDVCKEYISLADHVLPVVQELWDNEPWRGEAVSFASSALSLNSITGKAELYTWFLDSSLELQPNSFDTVYEKIWENLNSPHDAIVVAKKMHALEKNESARNIAQCALDIEGLNDTQAFEWIYEFAEEVGDARLKQDASTRLFKQFPTLDNFLKAKEATSEGLWMAHKQNLLNFLRARTVTSYNEEVQGKLAILIYEGHASEALDVAIQCPQNFGQAQLLEVFINQAIIQERNVQFINQVKNITEKLIWRRWDTVTSTTTRTRSFTDKNDDPAITRILKTLSKYDEEFTQRVSPIHKSLSQIRNYQVQTSSSKSYQHLVKILESASKHFKDNDDHPIGEWRHNVENICGAHSTKRKLVRMIEDMCHKIADDEVL